MDALLPVYRRSNLIMDHGQGVYLYAQDGTRYLDCAAGIAVNALGHGHPHLLNALMQQAQKLWHCSNLYHTEPLHRLATRLTQAVSMDRVFFCNSGSEAVECAIKIIRRYGTTGAPQARSSRHRIITFHGGFHGRTMACISAGGNAIAREGYGPLLEGFDAVPFNDLEAVTRTITADTAGILVEAIQGEGGIHVATPEFLQGLRTLADTHGLLLCCDEVQAGMGRTGMLSSFEWAGVTPDLMTVAKGIGGGFPLAACLSTHAAAASMSPGRHGSTYGANPLAMAVGNAVLDIVLAPGFLQQVQDRGAKMREGLETMHARFPHLIQEVRGRGLLLGLKLQQDPHPIVERLRNHGLLTSAAQDQVIRITPPLIIADHEITEALAILARVCEEIT